MTPSGRSFGTSGVRSPRRRDGPRGEEAGMRPLGLGSGFVVGTFHSRPTQFNPETAALPLFGDHPRRPAHAFECAPDDRQTDAGSGVLIAGMEALKDSEEPVVILLGDPDSVILDPDAHASL